MFFGLLTLFTALSMAGVAAWFAIAGIVAVFAGAPIAAFIMGAVIELGKVVGVSWLYRNKDEPTKIKYALFPLVIVAMLLTSMGIFGFLSKAHLEQGAPVGNNIAKIERIDQQIQREQSTITDAETVVGQLDQTVNSLVKNDRISGPNGARSVRQSQEQQRAELRKTIEQAQVNIDKLEDEKFELSQSVREMELEVGPVKYIAELIYGEGETNLEKAVRLVIIAFIFIFDPMAIVLLMAANYTLMKRKEDSVSETEEEPEEFNNVDEPDPSITSVDQLSSPLTQFSEEDVTHQANLSSEDLKKLIAELGQSHEITPEEQEQREALSQILKQRQIRDQMRAKRKG